MIKNTSLTVLEVKLLSFFLENITVKFGIREVARKTNLDYKLVHLNIQKLVNRGVVLKERYGNVDLCSLNLKGNLNSLFYVELLRKDVFLEKNKEFKKFFVDVLSKSKEIFYILLVFGSFAKGKQSKSSDLDLMIIAPNTKIAEEIERVINSESIFLSKKVQTIVLSEKDFINNLTSKDVNVVIEAFKNHVLIGGVESFYEGVKKSI